MIGNVGYILYLYRRWTDRNQLFNLGINIFYSVSIRMQTGARKINYSSVLHDFNVLEDELLNSIKRLYRYLP